MKPTIFGCFNLFHITASLQNAYVPNGILQWAQNGPPVSHTNLLRGLATLLGDPQEFDTDRFATVDAFPYI